VYETDSVRPTYATVPTPATPSIARRERRRVHPPPFNPLFPFHPLNPTMIITITGLPGSGKSTAADALAKQFNLKRYYMGGIRRDAAKERGLTLEEFNKIGESEDWTDKMVDDYQKKLGETENNFIIEGRTSFFLIPNSLKIFLDVDLKIGAERIFKEIQNSIEDKRNEGKFNSVEETLESLKNRVSSDTKRYQKYYKINVLDPKQFDVFLDTTNLNAKEVIQILSKKIEEYAKTDNKSV